MLEILITDKQRFKLVEPRGRIDGLSAPEIQTEFEKLTSSGARQIIVSFKSISYISSAGLRVFLTLQKTLKKIGGELILVCLAPSVREVFSISGFASIFRIYETEDQIPEVADGDTILLEISDKEINGIRIHLTKTAAKPGIINIIGSQEKLSASSYTDNDVAEVNADDIQYGTGLAAMGDEFDECKNLFGETLIINRNFFTFPALKKSAVDYMLSDQVNNNFKYKFLHGFRFSGEPSLIFHFDQPEEYLSLASLIKTSSELAGTNLYGVVLLAESGGIYGMHLKKSPIQENKPEQGRIFEQKNFADWMDFPLEAAEAHHIIAACGISVKNRDLISEKYRQLFSADAQYHIHAASFEKGLLSKDILNFNNELNRIVNEMQAARVQHLLGKSKFKNGMLAIIDLEEC